MILPQRRRDLMNPIASLSLTTYPHPTSPKIAANPVAVEQMGPRFMLSPSLSIYPTFRTRCRAIFSTSQQYPRGGSSQSQVRHHFAAGGLKGSLQSGVTLTTQQITAPPAWLQRRSPATLSGRLGVGQSGSSACRTRASTAAQSIAHSEPIHEGEALAKAIIETVDRLSR
jgi:hypothetical protein